MYGHPYGQGWRAIMTAARRRRRRKVVLTVAAVAALCIPALDAVARLVGAW
jgi:hypothetical protein